MKRVIFAIAGFLAVFSCTTPEEEPQPEPSRKDTITLSSPAGITLPVEGGSATITFSASGDWTAALANDRGSWLDVSPSSGSKDEGSIMVSAGENPDTDDRSAVVRLTCGKASASVTVTQKQKDALTQTPSKTQFGAEGGSFTIEVKSNIDYSFEIAGDWIHQSSTRAMTTKTTTFIVDENDDTRKREGSVTVKSSLGSEKVTIYQDAVVPSIILSADKVSVGTEGGTFTVDVNTNVDVTMAITAGAEWLSEVRTRAMNTHSYTFQATANDSPDQREGTISFRNEANGLSATVTVTQMQKDALIIAQALYEIGANGGNVSIEAAANIELDVQISQPWVSQVITKSFGTQFYDFAVGPNTGYDVRECEITFTAKSEEPEHDFDQDSPWGVIGTIGGDAWTTDIEMSTDGTWHVAAGVTVSSSDEFKFRRGKDWGVSFGYADYNTTTVSSNVAVPLMQGGGNLKLAAGTYDMYLNPDDATAYFIPAGAPFGPGGTGSAPLSATVTIRQDGADGFLADFKEQYELSAREQTLELKSRSSVEIQAQSQADWITVVQTRALSNRFVDLQIAENTSGDSRTGKVTVSAPALGISREVTIVQHAEGDIVISDDGFLAYLLDKFDSNSDEVLSKEECEDVSSMYIEFTEYPGIASFSGLEYFPNLMSFSTYGENTLLKEVDCSNNKKLSSVDISDCPSLTTLDVSKCRELWYLRATNDRSLANLLLPEEDFRLKTFYMWNADSMPDEIDLSMCPLLEGLSFTHSGAATKKIWLRTGVNLSRCELTGAEIHYKGEAVEAEAPFVDAVFKELITSFYSSYDLDMDGKLSTFELSRITSIGLCPGFKAAKGVINSLEDLALFTNLESVNIYDYGDKVSAPIPQALKSLKSLETVNFSNCRIQGTLPEWITRFKQISFNNSYPLGSGEPLPLEFLANAGFEYFDLRGCSFGDVHITVPNSWLVEDTEKSGDLAYAFCRCYPQRSVTITGHDGGSYTAAPVMTFRSEVDGTAGVHPDGEAVLYHAATKGPGVDIVITGDGFTAENNTVGGTLETYLTACADRIFKLAPYDRLQEYFNVWLVYAHSRNEGTSDVRWPGKFGSYQQDITNTTCEGNSSDVVSFLSTATGRDCRRAAVAVVMNSPFYGGTCHRGVYSLTSLKYSVGYFPADQLYGGFLDTFSHEVLGHAMGRLGDEYGADSASPGFVPSSDNSNWTKYGWHANIDCQADPALIQWHAFLSDPRYASEGLGVFEGANYANSGWYRPTENSLMRLHFEDDGKAFNAPSREAIYQWTLMLSDDSGASWSTWPEFLADKYDYEEFVALDLAPSPNPAPAPKKARRARAPRRIVMHDGTVIGERPKPTPPEITIFK